MARESKDISALGADSQDDTALLSLKPRTHLEVTVDSGSATSCIPKDKIPQGCKLKPVSDGPSSYTSASSHKIQVKGVVNPEVAFEGGLAGPVQLKVLEPLKKTLFSTSKMVDAGYRVVHQLEAFGGSYMEKPSTSQRYPIHRKGGVFVMYVWMRKLSGNEPGRRQA